MVQEPSHVKQLSPIHVCKIGLSPIESSVFSKTVMQVSFMGTLVDICPHVDWFQMRRTRARARDKSRDVQEMPHSSGGRVSFIFLRI
jgi:hypothetical protein